MGFRYPPFLFLLTLAAAVVPVLIWSRWKRRRDLERLGDWGLIRQLLPVEALRRRKRKDLIGLAGLLMLIIAAAGPQFGARLKEVHHRGSEIFIAMDVSKSMLAEDIPPTRMDRAKRALGLLINELSGNRIGIIAFARYAVIQCPLTIDTDAAKMFLEILDANTVPLQGTAIGDAIRLGLKSFSADEKVGKALVILTDGEDHASDPLEAAKEAKEKGVVIYTIGIGTTKGEVIKERDAAGNVVEYHKHKGELVMSRLDDDLLTRVAVLTGGRYYRSSSTDSEIEELGSLLNDLEKREFTSKVFQRLEDRYHWFALLAFLLLLLEFLLAEVPGQWSRCRTLLESRRKSDSRPGKIAAGILLCLLAASIARADVREDVRRGNQLVKQGKFEEARRAFESAQIDAPEDAFLPYNIAATHYLEGNFEEAKKSYEKAWIMTEDPALKARIAYNLGHVMFHAGDRDGAVEQFKKALRIDPKDVDAKYNIEYIRAGKNPKSPPPQKKKNEGKGPSEQQAGGEQKDGSSDPQTQEQEPDFSKEDAERVMQMMQDQESEKMKDIKALLRGEPPKEEEQRSNVEDW